MLFLIVLIANFAEAITGFGSTVITLTLGARLLPIDTLITRIVPLNEVLSLYLVLRYFRHLDRKALFRNILPLVGIGTFIGMWIHGFISQTHALETAFGVIVFFYGIIPLVQTFRKSSVENPNGKIAIKPKDLILLFAGGIVQGIFASGGPLVVTYVSKAVPDKNRFRTTLSMLWLILNGFLIVQYLSTQRINAETLGESLKIAPAVLLGLIAGELSHKKISELYFKRLVFFLLTFAGFALVTR